jgi:hypothetical protein
MTNKTVPREPTEEMIRAAFKGLIFPQSVTGQIKRFETMAENWRRMYDAAPVSGVPQHSDLVERLRRRADAERGTSGALLREAADALAAGVPQPHDR